jgi:hypothetical protein
MDAIQSFSPQVREALAYYVYRLVDPRTGDTFYVGKGTGDRAFHHAKMAVDSEESLRFDLIRRIREAGMEPIIIIHRHGLDEDSAYEVEAALIDVYPNLLNEVGGHGRSQGSTTITELVRRYDAPPARIDVPAILIKIERQWRPGMTETQLYDATRRWWSCSPEKQPVPPRYAISIAQGLIREVYEIEGWEDRPPETTAEPVSSDDGSDQAAGPRVRVRKGFIGRPAPEHLRRSLTLRSIRHIQFGRGNPITYANCRKPCSSCL